MLYPIKPGQVKYCLPYYIKCVECGAEISGSTPEEVAQDAIGWWYDYENDFILCGYCKDKGGENE